MIRTSNKIARVVGWLGLTIGLIVAVAGPTGYLLVSHAQVNHEMGLLAELKASRLSKYIYIHQELWQYHTLRLAELVEIPEAREVGVQQRLFDAAGAVVLQTGQTPMSPVVSQGRPVIVAGLRMATIETSTSFRPALVTTALVALFSSLLGAAIFAAIRYLPQRILARALVQLEATQTHYRLLFDANPFPMAVIAIESDRFLAVNDAAVEKYGWSRAEFLAMTSGTLYLPEDKPALMAARRRAPTQDISTVRGLRHRRKDGSVIDVEMSARPLRFEGIPAMLVLGQDITERNRVEQARAAAEEQLRQSQKMEAIGQLTGGIAHDFNNILTVILGNIEALEEEKLAPGLTARIHEIGGAVDRAAGLTRQLLSFARQQPLRTQITDLNDLVGGTASLLRRSLGAQVEISSNFATDLWAVKVDRTQIEAALVNLCLNSRDAMPDGGKLLIETRNTTLDDENAGLNDEVVAGDYAMLAVTDSGTGMPAHVLAKVFEPFFTTKEAGQGTGLGLSMVYGFIKQSKGHIKVYSEPGGGTTFKLYLPRTTVEEKEGALREKQAMPRGVERILVVEDEPAVRANTVEQLRTLGYHVTHAADGAAGLAACEAAPQPYRLLLTDVVMPVMGGKALADAVRQRWPSTRIVFMSGYAESAIVHHGNIDAGVLLLSKPFRKIELAQMVRRALAAP